MSCGWPCHHNRWHSVLHSALFAWLLRWKRGVDSACMRHSLNSLPEGAPGAACHLAAALLALQRQAGPGAVAGGSWPPASEPQQPRTWCQVSR